jgi:outer membrane receptor protein involved in Fe transport
LYDQNYVQTRAGAFGDPQNPATPRIHADASSSDGAFTYLSDLSWRFTDGGSVYFRAASGYRVGGPSALPLGAEAPPGFNGKFGAENLYDYEVGLKQSFLAGQLDLAASAFYINYRNMQGNMLLGVFVVTGNPGNAQDHGVELSAHARPIQGLSVDAAFGYADATLTQDAPSFNALKGDDLPNSPHYTASFSLSYEHALRGNLIGSIGGGAHYVSASTGDFSGAADATDFPAETIIDLHAGLKCKQFTATLFVKNAGNAYHYENNTNASGNGPPYVSVTRPRTIGLRFTEEF